MIRQTPRKDLLKKMTSAGFHFSPGVFAVKDANPEQTLGSFELYVESMQMAFGLKSHNRGQNGVRR